MKKFIKKMLSRFNIEVILIKNKENNYNNAFLAQKHLINIDNPIIFDVGAHIGTITLLYKRMYKNPTIYAFEPFKESFEELKKNTKNNPGIFPINMGLGDVEGKAKFYSNEFAPTNSLLNSEKSGGQIWGENILNTKEIVEINLTTIDKFVKNNLISKIDILKLDVQGAENLVLKGAENTLLNCNIDMIYTEIILLPTYENQSNFEEILSIFEKQNYSLYNIYNPSYTSTGQLRQIDVIFIRKSLI
jgi:FkbM family methyltransferase